MIFLLDVFIWILHSKYNLMIKHFRDTVLEYTCLKVNSSNNMLKTAYRIKIYDGNILASHNI